MEAKESIEIPFGAFDSELKGWEYTIPEGMEAVIKDGKIIVREKESEDERIRKALLNAFQESEDSLHMVLTPHRRESFIAWLEKQGSQNLANSAKTCKVEQNPAWSEEDETGLNDAMWAIEQARTIAKDENDMGNLWYAERWLKSLKERVQPQHQQEWSEDDKEALRVVTNIFEQHGVKLLCYPAFVHWLKTLPNRITFNPYWKPSDEQIISLDTAIAWCLGDKERVALKSLLSDLKKLKG